MQIEEERLNSLARLIDKNTRAHNNRLKRVSGGFGSGGGRRRRLDGRTSA